MSYELSLKIHKATRDFPKEERYGLSFELRKTSRS
ncbi:MAG: four helix bundle protein, partial [Candidatus Hydrogenedentota bacterium]